MTLPRRLVLIVLLVALATPAFARETWRARGDIELNPILRDKIGEIAARYYAKTKRVLEITSGYRSPSRQAGAMYTKLAAGGSLAIYKNQSLVQPLYKAYREGRKKRWKKDRIVAAMAAVLASQVERGIYLSRHMKGRAFDVRSVGMSGRQRAALRAAIAEVGGLRLLYESKPPHFHIEILETAPTPDEGGERDDIDAEDEAPAPPEATPQPLPDDPPRPAPDAPAPLTPDAPR